MNPESTTRRALDDPLLVHPLVSVVADVVTSPSVDNDMLLR